MHVTKGIRNIECNPKQLQFNRQVDVKQMLLAAIWPLSPSRAAQGMQVVPLVLLSKLLLVAQL